MIEKNLMIVQGGGPTAVFNASLSSAIREALLPGGFAHVWGARAGMFGLSQGQAVDLGRLSDAELQLLCRTPGAALGSSRFSPDESGLHRALETLQALQVQSLIFAGGNGTMRGAQLFAAFCRSQGYAVQVIGVPKTVDNDLAVTHRSPGFASAARYVALSTQELGLDIRSLPQPVTIFETMGRSVGWLAAASTLAIQRSPDAPHLVYVPEIPFLEDDFLGYVDDIVAKQGWAVVVVAEGISRADGTKVFEYQSAAQQDALMRPLLGGVAKHLAGVVAEKLQLRCRNEQPGLLGRSSMAHIASQDLEDALLAGAVAVRALLAGESDKMVALLAVGSGDGSTLVPLDQVAGVERPIPAEWLTDGPLAVTDAFHQYLRPLVGQLNQYLSPLEAISVLQGVR